MDASLRLIPLSSLEKVFVDEAPAGASQDGSQPGDCRQGEFSQATTLRNERFSFQVAWYWDAFTLEGVQVQVVSPLEEWIRLYQVGLVPCGLPNWHGHDGHVLRTAPGLFPDPLLPIPPQGLQLLPDQWRALWVEVDGSQTALPEGTHEIRLHLTQADRPLGEVIVTLDVLPAVLPPQTLLHTQWFHTDCLAVHYGDDILSEGHWTRIAQYMDIAVRHGINTLLTPLFTPPLDTAVGAERPTVQLVDVWQPTDPAGAISYRFGFERLNRWLALGDSLGVRIFELSHLFTQWGAAHAPKVVATQEDGSSKRIFGWDTDATGPDYVAFLDAFLPELTAFLEKAGYKDRVLYHVSDEPSLEHVNAYQSAASLLHRHIGDAPVLDALSDFAFYEKGLVANPVPANNHIQPFLDAGIPDLWTYYCCGQNQRVSNRFFSMPSARNRILGMQLFKFKMAGFLHWGFNFWNTRLSVRPVDPFRETDAGGAFPGGDAFLVYPGAEGPIPSLRMKVLAEALQDLRALQALSEKLGFAETLALLEQDLSAPLTFEDYPRDASWLLETRERINRALAS
jgi:hypothetical protein